MSQPETVKTNLTNCGRKNKIGMLIALCLCLFSMIFQNLLATSFGKTDIHRISLQTASGLTLSGDLYVPKQRQRRTLRLRLS